MKLVLTPLLFVFVLLFPTMEVHGGKANKNKNKNKNKRTGISQTMIAELEGCLSKRTENWGQVKKCAKWYIKEWTRGGDIDKKVGKDMKKLVKSWKKDFLNPPATIASDPTVDADVDESVTIGPPKQPLPYPILQAVPAQEVQVCDEDWQAIGEELEQQRDAWKRSNKTDCYTMRVSPTCMGCQRGSFTIAVINGTSTVAMPPLYTMDGAFDLIQKECVSECPEKGAYSCSVSYMVVDDVPVIKGVSIDYKRYMMDEETMFTIDDFVFTC
jgi:hypothetical protein